MAPCMKKKNLSHTAEYLWSYFKLNDLNNFLNRLLILWALIINNRIFTVIHFMSGSCMLDISDHGFIDKPDQ